MGVRSALFAAALSLGLSAPAWAGFKDGERAFDAGDYAAAAIEWRPLAENGDGRAQTNLGHLYRLGQGVERDYGEALKWYRLAANQGNTRAQANLGNMYLKGLGVDADPAAGVALFRQAAERGFAVAQLYLGDFYRWGKVVVPDAEQAALWYGRAADQGHPEAALRLGRLYLAGTGVAIDEARAARWLRQAATFGLAAAQYDLAELYRRGRGVERDLKEATRWYHAAAVLGHVGAIERLTATDGDAADDPNHQLRVAAEVGDAAAQMRLATLLREGDQMPRNATAALEWYRRAAAQGHARASYNLGMMYHDGDGVVADDIMAAAWFRRAAELGEADAQYTLGVFLSKGTGGGANPAEAREWFLRAARQGDSRAQFSLGVMYEKGAGGAADPPAAMKWYSAAAEQGDLRARERFAALTVEMAARTPTAAELEPLDDLTDKTLAESAAAALDAIDRGDDVAGDVAGEPVAGLTTLEPRAAPEPQAPLAARVELPPAEDAPIIEEPPTAALEAEAPATVEAISETLMETPPGEAEPEGVTVTSGTGIAKQLENLDRNETAGPEAPAFEFHWFGDDPEAEPEPEPQPEPDLASTTETAAREPEAGAAVGALVETSPETATGNAETDDAAPADPAWIWPTTAGKEVDTSTPVVEYDLFRNVPGGFVVIEDYSVAEP